MAVSLVTLIYFSHCYEVIIIIIIIIIISSSSSSIQPLGLF
jgi:hypothetical protein